MKKWNLIPLSLAIISGVAQAELIEADARIVGDNNAVYDTKTRLNWLDIDLTAGMSVTQAMDAYADEGWRVATEEEVFTLFYLNVSSQINYATNDGRTDTLVHQDMINNFMSVFGVSASTTGWRYSLGAYQDDEFEGKYAAGGLLDNYYETNNPDVLVLEHTDYANANPESYVNPRRGVYLVKGESSYTFEVDTEQPKLTGDVPAPFLLSGLGLIFLASRRKKA